MNKQTTAAEDMAANAVDGQSSEETFAIMLLQNMEPMTDEDRAAAGHTEKVRGLIAEINALKPEDIDSMIVLVKGRSGATDKGEGFALIGGHIGVDGELAALGMIIEGRLDQMMASETITE
jgi:enhancing lycopene biosynthesis protein 2